MRNHSIKILDDIDISDISGGIIINSNFDFSNLQPVFAALYKNDLVIPRVSFNAIENKIVIKSCKILNPEKLDNSTLTLRHV